MRFFIKTSFFLLGISVIGLMLWFGMPNIKKAFKPIEMISVTITLINKCSVGDDSFIVTVPGTNIEVPFKKGVENKQKIEAEDRLRMVIGSIDVKMQQSYWDAMAFDDVELELLSNFGETIKFPSDNTAARVASVLATYILKTRTEDFSYE